MRPRWKAVISYQGKPDKPGTEASADVPVLSCRNAVHSSGTRLTITALLGRVSK